MNVSFRVFVNIWFFYFYFFFFYFFCRTYQTEWVSGYWKRVWYSQILISNSNRINATTARILIYGLDRIFILFHSFSWVRALRSHNFINWIHLLVSFPSSSHFSGKVIILLRNIRCFELKILMWYTQHTEGVGNWLYVECWMT